MKRKSIQSLAFDNLTFGFDHSAPLFENITMEMPKTRAVWVRSPGGRGKSSFLRLMAGLLSPQSGKYLINGQNVSEMSFEDFLSYRLAMGYGFDMGGLLNNKTLFENLMLPLQYHKIIGEEEAYERVQSVTDMFGMTQSRDYRPFSVSGSQRKLACIVRAFIHWPQVVYLDDPVTGLKEDNVNDLLYFVEEGYATRGLKQIFFSSESPALANKLKADELMISCDWFTTRVAA